jgi:predicted ATP-binding protein involved in virulence
MRENAVIRQFEIQGLFGSKNIKVVFENNSAILVGPNGIGKTTILDIFYFLTSGQFDRLMRYEFQSIAISTEHKRFSFDRASFDDYKFNVDALSMPQRFQDLLVSLVSRYGSRAIENLNSISQTDLFRDAKQFGLTPTDVRIFQQRLSRIRINQNLFSYAVSEEFQSLSRALDSKIVYLPTYRRIEKDLDAIFPDIDDDLRERLKRIAAGRRGENFIELVSFGMSDVTTSIEDVLKSLLSESVLEMNALSSRYLKDVIQKKIDNIDVSQVRSLDPKQLDSILARLDEKLISTQEKQLLGEAINNIKSRQKGRLKTHEKYLAYYVYELFSIWAALSTKAEKLKKFESIVNEYISPQKHIVFNDNAMQMNLTRENGDTIPLSQLSSGEKQIVAIFANLLLSGDRKSVLVIDEPELSLSVVWQKKLLPDIIGTGQCNLLFAVTHSPFTYQNHLKPSAVDVRKFIEPYNQEVGLEF